MLSGPHSLRFGCATNLSYPLETLRGNRKESMYSEISTVEGSRIYVRGRDLVDDLMGKISFTEMIHLTITGEMPNAAEKRVLDAVLVALVDHGVTSSSLAARMTYRASPDAVQGAIAAGLLNAGGRVLGSMEGCGRVLSEWTPDSDDAREIADAAGRAIKDARANGSRIPGLGHNLHEDGDFRAVKLFEVAEEVGLRGRYVAMLEQLAAEASRLAGKQLPINVTGAIAAVLLEIGIDWRILRGFGLMSRVVGLVAHVGEEQRTGRVGSLVVALQHGDMWDSAPRQQQ